MKIEVTQEDIDRGVCKKACLCPVARALKRVCGYGNVSRSLLIYGKSWDDFEDMEPPQEVTDFVDAFDAGEPVRPFTFEIP